MTLFCYQSLFTCLAFPTFLILHNLSVKRAFTLAKIFHVMSFHFILFHFISFYFSLLFILFYFFICVFNVMVSSIVHYSVVILLNRNYYSKWKIWLGLMAYFRVFPRLCFKTRLSAKLLITTTTTTTIIVMIKLFYILFIYFFISR